MHNALSTGRSGQQCTLFVVHAYRLNGLYEPTPLSSPSSAARSCRPRRAVHQTGWAHKVRAHGDQMGIPLLTELGAPEAVADVWCASLHTTRPGEVNPEARGVVSCWRSSPTTGTRRGGVRRRASSACRSRAVPATSTCTAPARPTTIGPTIGSYAPWHPEAGFSTPIRTVPRLPDAVGRLPRRHRRPVAQEGAHGLESTRCVNDLPDW